VSTVEQAVAFEFTAEEKEKIKQIVSRYPDSKAATLPALWVAQKRNGWVSPAVCNAVAGELDLSNSFVMGVATFYTMFNKAPVGKYHIQICRTLSCQIMGAGRVYEYISDKLGIADGETSEDGRYTLTQVECLASCGTAPMMQINEDYYENLTEEKIDQILEGLK